MCKERLQLASLDVPVDDDHPPVVLQADTEERASLVDGELTGEHPARGELLDGGEVAGRVVNREVDEHVRGDLRAVVGVEVGDLEGRLAAR